MESNNTFSLSLQKQIEQQHVLMDSEINSAFNELNFRSLLYRSGITKQKGYATITLLFLIVLLPFLKRKLSDFWNNKCLQNQIDAQKDTYYWGQFRDAPHICSFCDKNHNRESDQFSNMQICGASPRFHRCRFYRQRFTQ